MFSFMTTLGRPVRGAENMTESIQQLGERENKNLSPRTWIVEGLPHFPQLQQQ